MHKATRQYRTFEEEEIEEKYFRKHPEEIDEYLFIIFDEYARDGDTGALLSSLRRVTRAQGVTATASAAGLSRKGLQKILSEEGNPKFESINAIMQAMGYRLIPQKIKSRANDDLFAKTS